MDLLAYFTRSVGGVFIAFSGLMLFVSLAFFLFYGIIVFFEIVSSTPPAPVESISPVEICSDICDTMGAYPIEIDTDMAGNPETCHCALPDPE